MSARATTSLSLLALTLGCSSPPPRYPITDPAMALQRVRERDGRIHSLRAHGSAEHYGAQGRIRGEIWVFVERPDHVRVDTRAFGNTVSQVVSDGRRFTLADMRQGQFYVGRARPCVAAQLLGIPMESAEVVAVLAGGPPVIEGNPRIRWDDGHYVVDIAGRDGRSETLTLEITESERTSARPDAQRPRATRAELRDRQGVRAVLTYEDWTEADGVPFPRRVRLVMERSNVDLQVRYREVSVDPELPEDVFDTAPPSAMTMVPVQCEGDPPPAEDPGTDVVDDSPQPAADAGTTDAGTTDAESAGDAGPT